MTVREMKELLESCNQDALVFFETKRHNGQMLNPIICVRQDDVCSAASSNIVVFEPFDCDYIFDEARWSCGRGCTRHGRSESAR